MGRAIRFRRLKQWGRFNTRFFWKLEIARNKEKFPHQPVPAAVKEQGIKLEDPNDPDFPRKTSPDPIELNHPAWLNASPPEANPWYREVPGFLYTGTDPLAEGIHHALAISKGVLRQGLPESILKAADWLKLSATKANVEQLILHSQRWDSTIQKLPKRRDPTIWWHGFPRYFGIPMERKNDLLLDNLFRFTQIEGNRSSISEFRAQRFVRATPINVAFDRNGKTICINVTPQTAVSFPESIPAPADEKAINETMQETLFDIRPVTPTVDLAVTNILNPTLKAPFSWSGQNQLAHTIFVNKTNDVFYPWSPHELTGHAVMSAFAAALSSAKRIFPGATGKLPKPITVQCVQVCGSAFEFVVYQLNTVDFKDDSGVKNIVYVDASNKLFTSNDHWKTFEQVADYDPNVLRKFVALLSNGVSIRK